MKRVVIVGPGGSGKSTFASRLAESAGLPVTHLDAQYWRPGWVEPSREQWRLQQREMVKAPCWILDGNYGGTFDERLPHADTMFIFALPRLQYMAGAVRRTVRNHGQEIQAVGCPERLDIAFLKYLWRYPKQSRPRLDAAIAEYGGHLRIIEFTSRRDVEANLATAGGC